MNTKIEPNILLTLISAILYLAVIILVNDMIMAILTSALYLTTHWAYQFSKK